MPQHKVLVEIVEADSSGRRQIGAKRRLTAALHDRRSDIEAAVQEATETVTSALDATTPKDGWRVSNLEATFGLTLTTEAGVIVSRISAEAALEIKITVERL